MKSHMDQEPNNNLADDRKRFWRFVRQMRGLEYAIETLRNERTRLARLVGDMEGEVYPAGMLPTDEEKDA